MRRARAARLRGWRAGVRAWRARMRRVGGRRLLGITAAAFGALALGLIVGLIVAPAPTGPPDDQAAALVPADALAYINLSLDRGRPAVRRSLALARRLPALAAFADTARTRLAATISPTPSALALAAGVREWLGDEAAFAVLNTPGTVAGSLLFAASRDRSRARAFLSASGARAVGSERHVTLWRYPTGAYAALVGRFVALGQLASVRAAIDVADGARSLAASAAYRRAAAGEPADAVLEAYVSGSGVRRLLEPRPGLLGALGVLLDRPALLGVGFAAAPTADGFRILVRSALAGDARARARPAAFHPALPRALPASAVAVLDVEALPSEAPRLLRALERAGIAGRVGPLLARLGQALRAEGADVGGLLALLRGESALALTQVSGSPALLLAARDPQPRRARYLLAQAAYALEQSLRSSALQAGEIASISQIGVDGTQVQQLALQPGVQLDYAVTRRLVIVATGLRALAQVLSAPRSLTASAGYRAALPNVPARAGSLLYLDSSQLFGPGARLRSIKGAGVQALKALLGNVQTIGLTATGGRAQATANIHLELR
jgi:hypothetical protein